jgi:hypothetical protein
MAAVLRRTRRIAFVGVAAWMLLSPAYVQVFGGREDAVRAWRMFHRRGVGICSAVYYDHDRRIDRYALFGQQRASAPADFRRITDAAQARLMAQQICTKLAEAGAQTPDVRVTLRCGVMAGLQTVLDREENLCGG